MAGLCPVLFGSFSSFYGKNPEVGMTDGNADLDGLDDGFAEGVRDGLAEGNTDVEGCIEGSMDVEGRPEG